MSLRIFCLRIFQHCPLLASFSAEHHTKAFEEFLQYKTRVPVRGAIMLNQAMDSVVLVKGWKKGASWSFPRGKINKDEDDLDCAIREVYEETGLDLRAAGLAPTEKKPKYIEISMREQQLRLYVFRDIPMDTNFQPRTRKEISKIQWYKLSDLPTFRKKGDKNAQNRNDAGVGGGGSKFYMVAPFLVPLKKWIASQKKVDEKRVVSSETPANIADHVSAPEEAPYNHPAMEDLGGAGQDVGRSLAAVHGLHAPPQEDKGSALLSILQAGDQRGGNHISRTPLDLTMANPPQPRNPHHHSIQQHAGSHTHAAEPPPAFQLAPQTATHSSMLPQRHTVSPRSALQNGGAMPQRLYSAGEEGAPAHTQTLPFHIQRAVLDRSAFPGTPSTHQTGHVLPQQGRESQPAHVQGQAHPQAMQPHGPVQLNGHSMALLNVLKRDANPAIPPAQNANGGQNRWSSASHAAAADLSPYAGHAVPRQLPRLFDSSVRHASLPKTTLDLGGYGGYGGKAPSDSHRSALLGMFKKAEPEPVRHEAQGGSQGDAVRSEHVGEGAKMEEALSQKLHDRLPEARAFSLDQVAARTKLAQHDPGRENMAPLQQASGQAPLQPNRILQRGQTSHDGGCISSSMSPHGAPGPRESTRTGTMPSPDELGRRPGGSNEQKRRLLSLFNQQPGPLMGKAQEGGEADKPRVASAACGSGGGPFGVASPTSSGRGTETPMSPAEQSFFLEYLQTVTNNASR